MNWFLSFVSAGLAGIAGLIASGWVASLHAGWHQMSNREGAVGYFVVLMALLGGLVSFIAGLIVARSVAGSADPGFWKAVGGGLGLVAVATFLILLLSRITADIPPKLDGKELILEVEFRLPEGAAKPVAEPGTSSFELQSVSSGVLRDSEYGQIFPEQAREEEGRFVVPARAHVYTSRGQRAITASIGEAVIGRFMVPLPGKPGPESLEWSDWLPQPRPGESAWPATESSFRFRVQSQP